MVMSTRAVKGRFGSSRSQSAMKRARTFAKVIASYFETSPEGEKDPLHHRKGLVARCEPGDLQGIAQKCLEVLGGLLILHRHCHRTTRTPQQFSELYVGNQASLEPDHTVASAPQPGRGAKDGGRTFVYAYPLVLSELTRRVDVDVDGVPMNVFYHKATFPDANFT
jgi:hypothetical protein